MSFKTLKSDYPVISLGNWSGLAEKYLEDFASTFKVFIGAVNKLHEMGFQKLSLELGSDYGSNWGQNNDYPLGNFRCQDQLIAGIIIFKGQIFLSSPGSSRYETTEASVQNCVNLLSEILKKEFRKKNKQ